MEPRYIADGDEFDEEDNSWRYPDSLNNQDVIHRAFEVCGHRQYFRSQKESRLWHKIDGQVTRGLIPMGWIEVALRWAKMQNAQVIRIKVETLGNFIMNKARMQDWMGEHKDAFRKPSDYDVPEVKHEE